MSSLKFPETPGSDQQASTTKEAGGTVEPKGSWTHAAYHLTSAIAWVSFLSLPYAFAGIGWILGLLALGLGALVSFYAYYLLSLAIEHLEKDGKRLLRFRDLAQHVLGPKSSYLVVAPLQFTVCFMIIIACMLLGGQTMKALYLAVNPEGRLMLYEFIIMFGTFTMVVSQLPSMHSLRYCNFFSMLFCLGYTLSAVVGSIMSGHSKHSLAKNHSISGTPTQRMFVGLNSVCLIISTYANAVVVEIQATLAAPTTGKMLKALTVCYIVTICVFFSVAISGYWAFGNASDSIILSNMWSSKGGIDFIPKSLFFIGNLFVFLQLVVCAVLYFQPIFETLDVYITDVKKGTFSLRNLLPRLLGRSGFVAISTFLAAMLPFFTDMSSVMGAIGCMPLCIVLPLIIYDRVLQPSLRTLTFWVNWAIILIFSVLALLGTMASVRQIVVDASTYKLFANL